MWLKNRRLLGKTWEVGSKAMWWLLKEVITRPKKAKVFRG